MISNRQRALEEGAKAAKEGKDIETSNPYQPGIDDHENFREGHLAVSEEGVKPSDVASLEPAPPAPVAVNSSALSSLDAGGKSEHPAFNVESGTPFDTSSTEVSSRPVTHVASQEAQTFTNS